VYEIIGGICSGISQCELVDFIFVLGYALAGSLCGDVQCARGGFYMNFE